MGYPLLSRLFHFLTHTTITANVKKRENGWRKPFFSFTFFINKGLLRIIFGVMSHWIYCGKNPKPFKKRWTISFISVCNLSEKPYNFLCFVFYGEHKKIESNLKSGKKHRDKKKQVKIVWFLELKNCFRALFFLLLCGKKINWDLFINSISMNLHFFPKQPHKILYLHYTIFTKKNDQNVNIKYRNVWLLEDKKSLHLSVVAKQPTHFFCALMCIQTTADSVEKLN